MSEQEKFEQVGRLVEEVSRRKGELNQINEKLQRAYMAYVRMQQSGGMHTWKVANGQLLIPQGGQYAAQNVDFSALLNQHELIQVLEHKQKLETELQNETDRLKGLAPHLF